MLVADRAGRDADGDGKDTRGTMTTPITDPEELGKILRRTRLRLEYPRSESWEIEADVERPIIAVWDRDISCATAVRDAVCPEGYIVIPKPKEIEYVMLAGGHQETFYADDTSEVICISDCGDEDDEEQVDWEDEDE